MQQGPLQKYLPNPLNFPDVGNVWQTFRLKVKLKFELSYYSSNIGNVGKLSGAWGCHLLQELKVISSNLNKDYKFIELVMMRDL